jgi:hypothetical protein
MKTFSELAIEIMEKEILFEDALRANRDIQDKRLAKYKNRFRRKAAKAGKIAHFEDDKFVGMKKRDPKKGRKISKGLHKSKTKQKSRMAKVARGMTRNWRKGINTSVSNAVSLTTRKPGQKISRST